MEIDIKCLSKDKLTPNEIIINDLNTYPEDLRKQMMCEEFCDDDFKNYFYDNLNFNVVGVHFTRLFDYEIEDIKANGLHSDDTEDYKNKINSMPKEFDDYKVKLIEHVTKNKRSHGEIYFDIGNIKIYFGNSIFLKNWGGETLYCFYDPLVYERKDLELAKKLRQLTIPCLIVVKVNAFLFFDHFSNIESLIDDIHHNDLINYSNEFSIDKNEVEVIDIIPVKNLKKFF